MKASQFLYVPNPFSHRMSISAGKGACGPTGAFFPGVSYKHPVSKQNSRPMCAVIAHSVAVVVIFALLCYFSVDKS